MDRASANLPARDMDATARFYEALGFTIKLEKESWMILNRGSILLEFFPLPDHNPRESCLSACLRVGTLPVRLDDHVACRQEEEQFRVSGRRRSKPDRRRGTCRRLEPC